MMTVMNTPLDEPSPAEPFDDALRWIIPSRTNPHESYVVELNAAPGFDACQCMHFQTKLQPLLARGVTPEQAVAEGLVKKKKGQRVEDVLKCWHICEAEYRLAIATKKAFCVARRAHKTERTTNVTPYTPPPKKADPRELPAIRREDLRSGEVDFGPTPSL